MMRLLRAIGIVVSPWFHADPARTLLVGITIPLRQFGGLLGAATIALLADAALRRDMRLALAAALLSAIWVVAQTGLGWFTDRRYEQLIEQHSGLAWVEATARVARVPSVEHLESPAMLDRLQLVIEDCGRVGNGFRVLATLLGFAIQLALIVAVLARIDPILLLLPLFALPSLAASAVATAGIMQARTQTAQRSRLRDRLVELVVSAEGGREARLFGLGEELTTRVQRLGDAVRRRMDRVQLAAAAARTGGWLVFGLAYLGALVLVTLRALEGRASPGQLLFTLIAAQQVQGLVVSAVGMAQELQGVLHSALRLEWLYWYAERARPVIKDPALVPGRLARGIEIREVSFRYPGTAALVLDKVSLTFPAGAVVALVGENGAGKTTLVKLLCRLYEPSAGAILADGVDIARFDIERWRDRLSAAFQDFCRFELVARESIGTGDLRRVEDAAFVGAAAERAGATAVVDALPRRLETHLGKSWEDGVELSGGQWQKVALSRTLMREVPLALVLDEPTAALDPRAEHELFERFTRAARGDRGQGQVTILVSHRFSTVRMADLIVVMDRGRVREVGSHDALLARGDLYAELYGIQAAAYR